MLYAQNIVFDIIYIFQWNLTRISGHSSYSNILTFDLFYPFCDASINIRYPLYGMPVVILDRFHLTIMWKKLKGLEYTNPEFVYNFKKAPET